MAIPRLQMCKVDVDGVSTVYLLEKWPDTVLIGEQPTEDMLPDTVMFNGKTVTVAVANGFASYSRQGRQSQGWICAKGESEFLPIPDHIR